MECALVPPVDPCELDDEPRGVVGKGPTIAFGHCAHESTTIPARIFLETARRLDRRQERGTRWSEFLSRSRVPGARPAPALNFRVFSRSGPPGASQHGAAFFKAQEFAMMDRSWLTLALSETDAACLRELHPNAEVRVLLPPIRADVMARARRPLKKADVPERHLITCCVRLSDEKEPERFVRLVENLAERKAFDGVFGYKVGLRPVGSPRTGAARARRRRRPTAGRRRWPCCASRGPGRGRPQNRGAPGPRRGNGAGSRRAGSPPRA